MPIHPIHVQRRMMQLGRVRLGEKGGRGEPKRLDTFRFTSASKALLDAVAARYGGTVKPWPDAPDEGYFQVTTDANRLEIILPPVYSDEDGHATVPYSQWFELWSGAGCQRRCDGVTESLSGQPCLCDMAKVKDGGDPSVCKVTTRVSFMLPDLPGLGVWRIDSHGWNAAVELPGTLEVLAAAAREAKFIPAVLSIQHRTKKSPGQPTRKFIVPVIELPDVTVRQLASGDVPLALNAPTNGRVERPALGPAPAPPPAEAFEESRHPGFGAPPPLPSSAGEPREPGSVGTGSPESDVEASAAESDSSPAEDEPLATAAQKKKLNVLVGKLRDAGHLTTEQLYRRCRIEPLPSDYDEEGVLHWTPLRDRLTKAYAHGLIEALTEFEASIANGSYFERRAAEVRERVGT